MEREELCMKYRELDRDLAVFYYAVGKYSEENRKIREKFIPNSKNMEAACETWMSLRDRAAALPAPDRVFALMKHIQTDFIDMLEFIINDNWRHPENSYLGLDSILQGTARCSRQPDQERLDQLLMLMRQLIENRVEMLGLIRERSAPEEWPGIAAALRRTGAALAADIPRIREYFPTFTKEQEARLEAALRRICDLEEGMAERILQTGAAMPFLIGKKKAREKSGSLKPENGEKGESGAEPQNFEKAESGAEPLTDEKPEAEERPEDLDFSVKMDRDVYRTLLDKQLGVDLDELLAWHREEMEKTRTEALAIGAEMPVDDPAPRTMREVNDLLLKYAGPCDTAEEMFARMDGYLVRTRALAHEYINLPEDEICRCVPICECCRDSYPWGGYEGGDFSIRPFEGQMFLNQYNVPAITDGWIKLNALHEAYPGHHCQFVRTAVDETPEIVKIGAKLVPLLEGTCLRTERAFEGLYEEDPFFRLFVAYRRHHASVRIYVDLMMYYYGATIADVIKIYQDELGFDFATARKQVRSHQYSPGYFTCYYYGMKKLEEWEREYGFSKKDFTELLFSAGYISIDCFGEYVSLTPAERERYAHDFKSLLR